MAHTPASSHGGAVAPITLTPGAAVTALAIHPATGATAAQTDEIEVYSDTGTLIAYIDAAGDIYADGRGLGGSAIFRTDGGDFRLGNFGTAGSNIQIAAGKAFKFMDSGGTQLLKLLESTRGIGFYNTTPAAQAAAIPDAAAGVVIDAEARAALNALLAAVRLLGLIAT